MNIVSFILRSFAALTLAWMLSSARAQQQVPRIGYVYPAGGQPGSEFQVVVGGQFLNGVDAVHVSGRGIQASVIEHVRPITPQQANALREKLMELRDKRGAATIGAATQPSTRPVWTAEDEKLVQEIRRKLADFQNRTTAAAISETVTLQIKVEADVEPAMRQLRLLTAGGLTNPLNFLIGELPEISESDSRSSSMHDDLRVTLPQTINGRIMPGDVDRFRFKARAGQQMVAVVSARELIPYLPDAVPGWFQATLALKDSLGNELGYSDDYRFNPDPLLSCRIPADGEYILEIKDAIYRGREDFVYRLRVGELPFITSIFPLGGRVGALPALDVRGWNLPASSPRLRAMREPGLFPCITHFRGLHSNALSFAVDTLPERFESEPNNQVSSAQELALPIVVNGRIAEEGDCDVFRIAGRAGEKVVAEVSARRLGSPLDSTLKLTDASGRQLALNDDCEDKAAGLTTHHADSRLMITLPGDGVFFLHLSDAQHKGGAEYAYRLRISAPLPDYQLRVAPSSINVRAGGTVPITVFAMRADGFAGDIQIELADAPTGFSLSGGRIPANQDMVRLTLSSSGKPQKPFALRLLGKARIAGEEIVRPVVPAEDMMQAFAYRHLVPAQELLVCVYNRGRTVGAMKLSDSVPLRIPSGGSLRLTLATPSRGAASQIQLELSEPPEGLTLERISLEREEIALVIHSDGKLKSGIEGNLIFAVFGQRAGDEGPNQRRVPLGFLPAIPFKIISP